MSSAFQIKTIKRSDLLYVQLEGVFDGGAALVLMMLLQEQRAHCQVLEIDTEHLERVEPLGLFVLHGQLRQFADVRAALQVTGKYSRRMLPFDYPGPQATDDHACECNGKCVVCHCKRARMSASSVQLAA